jgi:hypothetical protein
MKPNELDALIEDCLESRLSEADAAKLSARLEQSAEARARYWEAASIHCLLEHTMQSSSLRVITGQTLPRIPGINRWRAWRPLTAAAAGIVIGMLCTSVVFGYVARKHDVVQTLLVEGFENPAMILGRGVPASVGVWSGDLLAAVEAKDGVKPAGGRHMLALRPQEGRTQCSAYRFLDLTSLPPASAGQSRQIEVAVRFYSGEPGVKSRLRLRLTAFAEAAAEARELLMNGAAPERTLAHVEQSDSMKVGEWNTRRLVMDVPAEARVLLVTMLTGLEPYSLPMPERYLDDVRVRLITQEMPLP